MFNLLLDSATPTLQLPEAPLAPEHTLDMTPSFLKMGLSFLALMGALFVVIWLLRKIAGSKLGFFNQDSSIKVLEKKSLSPKTVLFIIEHNGQKMLITESSQHVGLHELPEDTLE